MSCWFVRENVRIWCEEVALVTAVPFYDTVNREVNPVDNVWWTVEFITLEREGTYCSEVYNESGIITIIVSAQPGIGDEAAVKAIELIIDELHLKKNDNLQMQFPEPFFEDTFGSADRSYRVGALLPYIYSN